MESSRIYSEKRGLYLDTRTKCGDPRGDSTEGRAIILRRGGLGLFLHDKKTKGFF
jgi:hypothetical protein